MRLRSAGFLVLMWVTSAHSAIIQITEFSQYVFTPVATSGDIVGTDGSVTVTLNAFGQPHAYGALNDKFGETEAPLPDSNTEEYAPEGDRTFKISLSEDQNIFAGFLKPTAPISFRLSSSMIVFALRTLSCLL